MNRIRVKTHILEKVMIVLMAIFFISAVWIFANAMMKGLASIEVAMIEILLIIILALLSQTIILIRIYDQH